MPTRTGHTSAIRASKVIGTSVFAPNGDKIGKVEDVVLDKQSNTSCSRSSASAASSG